MLLALVTALPANAVIPAAERAVLVSLYTNTGGANWTNTTASNAAWTVSGAPGNECTWYGVVCNGTGDAVTELNLAANNLSGALPTNLNALTSLQYFRAQQNALTGSLPSLSGLASLQYFDVRSNQLTGSLPALAGLISLRVFAFEINAISGPIPPLTGLSALEVFWGNNNQLSGNIPALGGLAQLQIFLVNNNQLSGSLPSLSGLTLLRTFYVGFNQLTGSIPSLAGLNALQQFRAENNQLTGALPASSSLQVLYVRNNQLSGTVPAAAPALVASMSALCPNQLTVSSSAAWDTATGSSPWSTGCTAPLAAQTLSFGPAPSLYVGGSGSVTATVSPAPGSSAAIVYSSLTPLVCSVNAAGTVTVLPAAGAGNICTIAADKAGDASFNTAPQASQSVVILAPVSGSCGSASGIAIAMPPSSNLCATGTASAVTTSASQFTWSCAGVGGGTTASCAAPRTYTVTTSVQSGSGSISPAGPQSVVAGGRLVLTIAPAAGSVITAVTGTCGGTLSGDTYTTNPITSADCSVIVTFSIEPARQVPVGGAWMLLALMALLGGTAVNAGIRSQARAR